MNNDRMEQNFERVFKLLDVLSVEVALNRNETVEVRADVGGLRGELGGLRGEVGGLRKDMEFGFERVDRRLGNIESRIEALEDKKGRR
jgi:hypothetical protein